MFFFKFLGFYVQKYQLTLKGICGVHADSVSFFFWHISFTVTYVSHVSASLDSQKYTNQKEDRLYTYSLNSCSINILVMQSSNYLLDLKPISLC